MAHEQTHALQLAVRQTGANSSTLLARALIEGVAEFVGELASGRPIFKSRFVSWQQKEGEYWQAFQRVRSGTDISRWLYNQGATGADWRGDRGYYMGYRIAQANYNRSADNARALRVLRPFF